MKLLQRIGAFTSALVLSMASLSVVSPVITQAAGNTCVWTGVASDNFNNASNWTGCGSVPEATDNLVFDSTTLTQDKTLNNDITGLSVGTVTFSGTGDYKFTVGGNALTVTSGIVANTYAVLTAPLTLGGSVAISGTSGVQLGAVALGGHTLTADTYMYAYGVISGSGNIVANDDITFKETVENTWSGSLTLTDESGSTVVAAYSGSLGNASNNITVQNNAQLVLCKFNGASVTQAISVAGDGTGYGAIYAAASCGMGGGAATYNTLASVTLAGAVTLAANTVVASTGTITVTGALSGNYTLTMAAGNVGSLVINSSNNQSATPNGTLNSPVKTTTYAETSPSTSISVDANEEAVVTGTYGDVIIYGGKLKGTGTVGNVEMSGGAIAPGLSPGVLRTGNLDFTGGAFEAEIGGTASGSYDQTVVTGTVALGTATTLTVTHWNGFIPAQGNTFMIISNDGSDAVSGTFSGLAEGATFTVSGVVYAISYRGGDGNDVVLTAQTVPAAPSTGFGAQLANPLITAIVTTLAASGMLLIAFKQQRATKRR